GRRGEGEPEGATGGPEGPGATPQQAAAFGDWNRFRVQVQAGGAAEGKDQARGLVRLRDPAVGFDESAAQLRLAQPALPRQESQIAIPLSCLSHERSSVRPAR